MPILDATSVARIRMIGWRDARTASRGGVKAVPQVVFASGLAVSFEDFIFVQKEAHRAAICAGIERARATGKSIGRPRLSIPDDEIVWLRQAGFSWREISQLLHISTGTLRCRYLELGGVSHTQLPKGQKEKWLREMKRRLATARNLLRPEKPSPAQ